MASARQKAASLRPRKKQSQSEPKVRGRCPSSWQADGQSPLVCGRVSLFSALSTHLIRQDPPMRKGNLLSSSNMSALLSPRNPRECVSS